MGKKQQWKNWSGSLSFKPGEVVEPESEEEISELVRTAASILLGLGVIAVS